MPTVSVIMPAYNVERYLAESIDSVLAQTYRDFEIVIVDDGSTDRTPSIAERYRRAFPDQVVLALRENRGVASARNTALGVARGAVLALLDSDDTWFPTFLAEQMDILDANPDVAIVTANAFNRGGPRDGRPVNPVDDRRPPPNLAEILRDETATFIMSVFRREVADAVGGFDESLRTNEDYDFWIRAALAGFRFTRNPKPLGWYRRRANSLSSNELRMIAGILRVFRKTVPSCEPGSRAREIAEQQVERFDIELLLAQARAALDEGDTAAAAAVLDAVRQRRHGVTLALVAHALRVVPRAAVWMYHVRRRLQRLVPRTTGALAPS
jgi:glycosyltransferase involved in cell wall biosynthesis